MGHNHGILAVVQAGRHVWLILVHVQATPAINIAYIIGCVKVNPWRRLTRFVRLQGMALQQCPSALYNTVNCCVQMGAGNCTDTDRAMCWSTVTTSLTPMHVADRAMPHLKFSLAWRKLVRATSSMTGPRAQLMSVASFFIMFSRSSFIRWYVSSLRLQCRLTTCSVTPASRHCRATCCVMLFKQKSVSDFVSKNHHACGS